MYYVFLGEGIWSLGLGLSGWAEREQPILEGVRVKSVGVGLGHFREFQEVWGVFHNFLPMPL